MNLQSVIEQLEPYSAGFHIDIMDNHFVPNLTWGAAMTNAIAKTTKKPLWIHLMVDDPTTWIDKFITPQDSIITIHIESQGNIKDVLQNIKKKDLKAGLAINPNTTLESINDYLPIIDQLLIMSVEPGFSGQKFIENSIKKVEKAVQLKNEHNYNYKVALDGGIDKNKIQLLKNKEITDFAVGSALFKQHNIIEAIKQLKK